ncbi:MAG: response regulator, partial [Sphingobacteriales bacterium]
NPKEIPGNGIDDDKNGYVDDVHGWNFLGGKDGKNVNADSYEAARVYHRFKSKFENVKDPSTLSKEDQDLYAMWNKASGDIKVDPSRSLNLMLMNNPRNDQKENLDILKFSATNLLAIVNDVLDFNKIESGKVVFENIRFNMIELMNSICGGLIIKAEEKGLEFKLDIDKKLNSKVLIGDPTRITQIIFNLVSNAIKFTQQGTIWVKVSCLEDRHNTSTVKFSVKDTGIGIEQNNLDVIFEPFAQESVTTTRQYGGTGLGLAIVKRLLELQGVQMNVNSKVGVGSQFSFNMEFPVSTGVIPEKDELQEMLQTDNLSNLQILIAEDNVVNVMLMKKLLSKWNITPTIAENGERAIQLLQYGNFDLILMDLQMPVMNGFEAAIEIRKLADPRKANIPIIALTASALFDIKEKVFASGMNDYVSKPFKPGELFEKIQSLVTIPH